MAFKSSNFCFERSSSLTIVLIHLAMLNGMLTFVCLGCPESKVMQLNESVGLWYVCCNSSISTF